tara:strand:+ start:2665 stop:3405 length:741 start_codon:yes stop_codon:yes gene_type:complete
MLIDSLDSKDGLWFNSAGDSTDTTIVNQIADERPTATVLTQSQISKRCYKCGSPTGIDGRVTTRSRLKTSLEKTLFGGKCGGDWADSPQEIGDKGDCGRNGFPMYCYKCVEGGGPRETSKRIDFFGGCRTDEFGIKGRQPTSCATAISSNVISNATNDVRGNSTAGNEVVQTVVPVTQSNTPSAPYRDGSVGPTYDDDKPKKKKKKKKIINVNRFSSTPGLESEDNTIMYAVIGLSVAAAGYIIYK